jgi:amidase
MAGFPEYERYDGLGLAELVRTKQVTPAELVEEAIQRIERHNPALNAVIYKLYDQARAAANAPLPDGPFAGVPFLIKDLMAGYAGAPLTSGSRFMKDYIPQQDTELVRRYKASGAVIIGKTNTPEFGLTPYTEPELFGPARNPWDTSRTPGGSSGGSAAAVAARIVPLASGGDGGGSLRIPASCCGIFALKPTRGRTPTGPDVQEYWEGFAVEGVLSRSVRDSAAMLDAIAGPDAGAPYIAPKPERPFLSEVTTEPGRLRIAFTDKPFLGRTVHEDCKRALAEAVSLLESLGHTVVEDAPTVDGEALGVAFVTMLCGNVIADMQDAAAVVGRQPTPRDFEISTWGLGMLGRTLTAKDYLAAVRTLQYAARKIGKFFEKYDALLTPTLARPPIPLGELALPKFEAAALRLVAGLPIGWLLAALGLVKPMAAKTFDFVPYTPLFNVTGQPAMSVPLHWNADGLPIGVQFVGRYADEATLFRLAGQLERACPWFDRVPAGL